MELANKTILDLNMYVLDEIFKNLKTLADKVNFAKAHPHLSRAFVYHSRNRFCDVDVQEFSTEQVVFVLKWCGSSVQYIKDYSYPYVGTTSEVLELADKHCPNIKYLDFVMTYDEDIELFTNLWGKILSLETCLSVDALHSLSKHCKKLEYLEFDYYDGTESFGYFPSLKRIFIENIHDVCFKFLDERYNNQLESLTFENYPFENERAARRISQLQALKSFCCSRIMPICTRHIARLPLEKLTLRETDKNVILLLISECKTLRWLHVAKTKNLYCDFYFELLKVLYRNGVKPNKPFVLNLYLYETNFNNDLRVELAKNSNGNLLEVQLEKYYYINKQTCTNNFFFYYKS